MTAVSRSRISPTSTMSGSARRIDRSAAANVRPAFGWICTWLMPGSRYSTGSSTVMMLRSGLLSMLSVAYSVVDLPEPVGPVTRIVPYGLRYDASNRACGLGQEARAPRARRTAWLLSRMRMTTFSPYTVGRVATRRSMLRPPTFMRDAAVLRDAALGDVDVGHDLEAADHAGLDAARRAHHLVQHAVDAEPDAQVVLGRLDVDVGRAVADGLGDEQVDELDDRRVLDELGDVREIGLVVGLVGRGLHDRVDFAVDAEEAFDRLVDLARGRDDGADLGAGEGADVVDREHVRRVGHRDDELAVLPTDRDRLVAAGERLGDERGDRAVDRAGR